MWINDFITLSKKTKQTWHKRYAYFFVLVAVIPVIFTPCLHLLYGLQFRTFFTLNVQPFKLDPWISGFSDHCNKVYSSSCWRVCFTHLLPNTSNHQFSFSCCICFSSVGGDEHRHRLKLQRLRGHAALSECITPPLLILRRLAKSQTDCLMFRTWTSGQGLVSLKPASLVKALKLIWVQHCDENSLKLPNISPCVDTESTLVSAETPQQQSCLVMFFWTFQSDQQMRTHFAADA